MEIKIEGEELYSVIEAAEAYREEGLFDLRSNGILIRVHEASGNALFSSLIPKDAMESYTPGELPKIGVSFSKLKKFIPKSSSIIHLNVVGGDNNPYKLKMTYENKEFTLGLVDPDMIAGQPDQVPSLDCAVKMELEWDNIVDFLKDYEIIRGSMREGGVYLSAREGLFYLWGTHDDSNVLEYYHWEDFPDYDIDWGKGHTDDKGVTNPAEDKRTDVIMSVGFLREVKTDVDTVKVQIDNHYPMKILAERDSGIKKSWIIPPRIPKDSQEMTIPDSIITRQTV